MKKILVALLCMVMYVLPCSPAWADLAPYPSSGSRENLGIGRIPSEGITTLSCKGLNEEGQARLVLKFSYPGAGLLSYVFSKEQAGEKGVPGEQLVANEVELKSHSKNYLEEIPLLIPDDEQEHVFFLSVDYTAFVKTQFGTKNREFITTYSFLLSKEIGREGGTIPLQYRSNG